MTSLGFYLARRLRPDFGWLLMALACFAALCPAFTASESDLKLPTSWFGTIGLFGLACGMWAGRRRTRRWQIAARLCGTVLLGIVLAATMLAIGEALPPLTLVLSDAAAYADWTRSALQTKRFAAVPESLTVRFLAVAVPRFWNTVLTAPAAGEVGAQLLLGLGGVLATAGATLMLGWALQSRRGLFGWGLPLAAVLAVVTVLGGGSGGTLLVGLGTLLVLAMWSNFRNVEAGWQEAHIDHSDQIAHDVLAWGGAIIVLLVTIGAVLPTAASTPLADLLWGKVELPSAIAVLDRNGARPPAPVAQIALSTLPAVPLGVSLEQQPPETIALRIQLDAPLPASAAPRYWRARLLNVYDGRQWGSNARVEPSAPTDTIDAPPPGYIQQQIEDLRPQRGVLLGLPNIVGLGVSAQAERLPDGTLAALTSTNEPNRYRVLSSPQERAAPPSPDAPPPDMGDALVVPRTTPPRVAELAQTVAGNGTQAEQTLAIEAYLRALPYSYQVRPLPSGGDAVDQFLFEMREGYCTYYASAMAVMARSLGIPARLAVGYATGFYDEATRTYTVRESDAHAWPELFVDGRWTAYEPTPVRPLPARGSEPNAPLAEPVPLPQPAPTQPQSLLTVLGIALVLLTLLAITFAVRQRQLRAAPVALALARLERAGAKAGLPWPAGATLREYGAALEPRLHGESQALRELIKLVERAQYRGEALHARELEQVLKCSKQVGAVVGRRKA